VLSHFESRAAKAAFVVSVIAGSLLVPLSLASSARQVGRIFPGFIVWRNLVVPAISAPAWPADAGDVPFRSVVVSVDGIPVRRAGELRGLVRAKAAGTSFEYGFRHNGQTVYARVPSAVLHWRDVAVTYAPYLLNGLVLFIAGCAVLYLKPGLPAARAFFLLASLLGSVLILAIDTLSSFWLSRLYFCLESLLPGALLHFASCFPVPIGVFERRPRGKALLYLPCAGLAILQNAFFLGDPERHLMVNDWVYTAIGAAGLVVIVSLIVRFTTSVSALQRQQIKVVLTGMAFAVLIPSVGLLGIIVLRADIAMNLLSPFYLLGPLSIGYAIARHDLFRVDRYLRTGVVYGALSLAVVLSYGALVLAVEQLLGAERRLPATIVPLYLLVLTLIFDPLRARIQRLVDRLLHRQAYDYRSTVEATSRALSSFLDSDRIARTVLDTLTGAMSIEWAVLFVYSADEPRRVYGRPQDKGRTAARLFPTGDRTIATLMRERDLVSRYDAELGDRLGEEERRRVDELHPTLLLRARFEDETLGVILVGEKQSGAYYSEEDLDLIQTLANQAALAIKNAQAYEIIRRTRDELVRAERLAAVGELAAAVAHGIRNPLAGIRAAAQMAREDVGDDGEVSESLDDIIGEADRLETRVRTMLDFARPFEPKIVDGDLNEFVRDFARHFAKRLPAGVSLAVESDERLPPVPFDPVQMTEVFEALAVNAVEAMGERGELRLRCELSDQNGRGAAAVISLSDTGAGMDASTQERVFTLFYTTKASGTGIGLAMAKRLVERQGGSIEVSSQRGQGTTFRICLRIPEAVTEHTA